MIRDFRHKGLRRLYSAGDHGGVPAELAPKIERILARLDIATGPRTMDLPGFRLHSLKGTLKGYWSVWVSGNVRIIFRFDGGNACDVDLIDYH